MNEGLSRRNQAAVEQQLRELDIIVRDQQIRINGLINSISTLCKRIEELEQTVALLRINKIGNGPTVT